MGPSAIGGARWKRSVENSPVQPSRRPGVTGAAPGGGTVPWIVVTDDVPSELRELTATLTSIEKVLDLGALRAELAEAEDDSGTREEVETELGGLQKAIGELEVRTLLGGDYDARDALKDPGGVLALVDEKGRRVVVPSNLIAYVEIADADHRRVGFAVS